MTHFIDSTIINNDTIILTDTATGEVVKRVLAPSAVSATSLISYGLNIRFYAESLAAAYMDTTVAEYRLRRAAYINGCRNAEKGGEAA